MLPPLHLRHRSLPPRTLGEKDCQRKVRTGPHLATTNGLEEVLFDIVILTLLKIPRVSKPQKLLWACHFVFFLQCCSYPGRHSLLYRLLRSNLPGQADSVIASVAPSAMEETSKTAESCSKKKEEVFRRIQGRRDARQQQSEQPTTASTANENYSQEIDAMISS